MLSRRKFSITARPRMNIWAKREKIEQIRQHHILGLTFDTGCNTLGTQRPGQKNDKYN
jgi:hypothetical protein